MANFKTHTLEEHTRAIAQYLPNDKVFAAKNYKDKNLYKMLKGFAGELKRVDDIFENIWQGVNILTTQDLEFIALWEAALGIPDDSFTETDSLDIEARRNQILIKLRSLWILTEQDLIDLAALLGETINIKKGIDTAYPPYSIPYTPLSSKNVRFVWIIQGEGFDEASYPPYDIPYTPTAPKSQLRSLFEDLKPANTILIFQNL